MFRIRRIHDDVLPVNKQSIAEVREIFLEHFPGAPKADEEDIWPDEYKIHSPLELLVPLNNTG